MSLSDDKAGLQMIQWLDLTSPITSTTPRYASGLAAEAEPCLEKADGPAPRKRRTQSLRFRPSKGGSCNGNTQPTQGDGFSPGIRPLRAAGTCVSGAPRGVYCQIPADFPRFGFLWCGTPITMQRPTNAFYNIQSPRLQYAGRSFLSSRSLSHLAAVDLSVPSSAMSGVNKYESQYREQRGVCGEPFPEIASFFESYPKRAAQVVDLGCGQGRDTLMAARYGHSVLGIDFSKTGIRQMLEDAEAEKLDLEGNVADLTEYVIEGSYDVIILDRVLHMLKEEDRIHLLRQVAEHVAPDGFVLIADMPSNKPAFRVAFSESSRKWLAVLDKKGFLFMRRDG